MPDTATLVPLQVFHVAYVLIKFANSPRPDLWVLERSTDFGHTYQPWQFFACECPESRAWGISAVGMSLPLTPSPSDGLSVVPYCQCHIGGSMGAYRLPCLALDVVGVTQVVPGLFGTAVLLVLQIGLRLRQLPW